VDRKSLKSIVSIKEEQKEEQEDDGHNDELEAALKKVIKPKMFSREEQKKIYNLNMVSATCDVFGLKRNNYNSVYLKANQIVPKIRDNKERIQRYFRENDTL